MPGARTLETASSVPRAFACPGNANLALAGQKLQHLSGLPERGDGLVKRFQPHCRRSLQRHTLLPEKRQRINQYAFDQNGVGQLAAA